MYHLSFCLLYTDIVIKVCCITCPLFMLQYWSLVFREGHKLSVFANNVVRKLGSNIKEVMVSLVKLHNLFVGSLNRLV